MGSQSWSVEDFVPSPPGPCQTSQEAPEGQPSQPGPFSRDSAPVGPLSRVQQLAKDRDLHRSKDGAARSLSPASRLPSRLLPECWTFLEPPRLYPIPSSRQPAWLVLSAPLQGGETEVGMASGSVAPSTGQWEGGAWSQNPWEGGALRAKPGGMQGGGLQLHTFAMAPLSSPPTSL